MKINQRITVAVFASVMGFSNMSQLSSTIHKCHNLRPVISRFFTEKTSESSTIRFNMLNKMATKSTSKVFSATKTDTFTHLLACEAMPKLSINQSKRAGRSESSY